MSNNKRSPSQRRQEVEHQLHLIKRAEDRDTSLYYANSPLGAEDDTDVQEFVRGFADVA
jgi:hypothetical protein